MAYSSLEETEFIVQTIAETAIENEKYFSKLDGVVGDGDFGISLANGFNKLLDQWEALDRSSPGTFLKKVSMIITSRVGGVSGAIWGTAFMKAGVTASDKQELSAEDVVEMLRAATKGMMKRGKSKLGDKTLLDAFVPATDAFEEVIQNGGSTAEALEAAAKIAREKSEETKDWIAKCGRASYTGERSIGTYDAGAVAMAVMAERLAEAWKERHS